MAQHKGPFQSLGENNYTRKAPSGPGQRHVSCPIHLETSLSLTLRPTRGCRECSSILPPVQGTRCQWQRRSPMTPSGNVYRPSLTWHTIPTHRSSSAIFSPRSHVRWPAVGHINTQSRDTEGIPSLSRSPRLRFVICDPRTGSLAQSTSPDGSKSQKRPRTSMLRNVTFTQS